MLNIVLIQIRFVDNNKDQTVQVPEVRQTVQVPEVKQTVQVPEVRQTVQVPEVRQTVQVPEARHETKPKRQQCKHVCVQFDIIN